MTQEANPFVPPSSPLEVNPVGPAPGSKRIRHLMRTAMTSMLAAPALFIVVFIVPSDLVGLVLVLMALSILVAALSSLAAIFFCFFFKQYAAILRAILILLMSLLISGIALPVLLSSRHPAQ